jgi:hypothetical protein
MTVAVNRNNISHVANGVLTSFVFDFYIAELDDIVIYFDGVEQSVTFTPTGLGVDEGGTIEFDVAPDDAVIVAIYRVIDLTQDTRYRTYGRFPGPTFEDDLDKSVYIDQQLQEQLGRCIIVPPSLPSVDYQDFLDAETNAAASAAEALVSENNAKVSETAAAASAAGPAQRLIGVLV